MSGEKEQTYKVIADMEVGTEFTFWDLAKKIKPEISIYYQRQDSYIDNAIGVLLKNKVIAIDRTEPYRGDKRHFYKKIANFEFKQVVVEWVEGFPDDWVAKIYVNGELVKVAKDW